MIKKIILLIFLMPLLIKAQIYRNDILMVLENMRSLKNYSMRINYKLYLQSKPGKPYQESSMVVKKKGGNLYYKKSDGTEFLSNKDFEVSIDAAKKLITAKHLDEKTGVPENENNDLLSPKNVDAFLGIYDKIKILENTSTKITYELLLKAKHPLESMTVSINKEKKVLELIKYKYREATEIWELGNTKHKVFFEMAYEDFNTSSVPDQSYFNEKKYIAVTKDAIKPIAKYVNYKINVLN